VTYSYVYRITNILLNKHYYGVRTSKNNLPKDDLGIRYFSSSRDKEFIQDQKINPQNYKYKIIYVTKMRKVAMKLEIKLHNKFEVATNENFYNRAKATSLSFDTSGMRWKHKTNDNYKAKKSKKHRENISKSLKGLKKSKEHCRNISLTHMNMRGENNPMYGKYGDASGFGGKHHTQEHKQYMSELMKNKPRVTCPHCQKVGAVSQMKRWHFNNCKMATIIGAKDSQGAMTTEYKTGKFLNE